ncbi:hypothetical protein C8J57DRAFT_1260860 [Mycena rebaudengoi]|jgi:hypothetical protein|nr:hypothetical protein C8J57DRAFT_1260860 [Mycena rebaudengoi]
MGAKMGRWESRANDMTRQQRQTLATCGSDLLISTLPLALPRSQWSQFEYGARRKLTVADLDGLEEDLRAPQLCYCCCETFLFGLAERLAPISEFEFRSDGFDGRAKLACLACVACGQMQLAFPLPLTTPQAPALSLEAPDRSMHAYGTVLTCRQLRYLNGLVFAADIGYMTVREVYGY